ncbi:MAG: Xylulose kinase [uncultured Pyrinomonadaceae bacterium]|uniref:Xylulose kinase n=1 Tax=uncultured Pyrinomonadaceae bacterium TaxID=2283094 RepID=A0A6J4NJ89_9BACT|nr:MAG: Xylulose kinase [uncultured Pyrinomonadaceae bacterium]
MNFLGIDVGTGGSRAVLIDAEGTLLASATVEHQPFASPEIGWAEQDARDWWRAAATAIRQILTEENIVADEIAAVGLSGQMHGAVFLDECGEVLRPSIIWCDQRTGEQCSKLTEKIGAEKLIELVSNPALPNFTLTKMLWLRENEPEIWNRTRSVLLPKDYVRFRLTGDKATDVSDASGTLMLDVRNRKWSSEILAGVEMSESLLPTLYESAEITGIVSAECAAATGLKVGTPVVAGAGDNAAGAVGMGIVRVGAVSATIGTSGVVFAVTEKPSIDLKGRIHTFCHAAPSRWHVTGVTQAAGLSLRWFRDNFADGESYDELVAAAAKISVGADGLLWTPYLMGERTPHVDSLVRASLIGLTAIHTKAHVVRAILEGVAFSLRDAIEIFKELKIPIETVKLGGGGAQSKLWQQIQADVYAQMVETNAAEEGAAYGAALLAGVGVGNWKTINEACDETIRVAEKITPNDESVKILNRRYRAYQTIYPSLRSIFQ